MDVLERAVAVGQLSEYLLAQGLSVSVVTAPTEIEATVRAVGKPYATPMTSPAFNDFTSANAFWLVAKRDGAPVICGAVRLEDLGLETVADYWPRVMRRTYGESAREVVEKVSVVAAEKLRGRLAYFGDLFIAETSRGNLNNLRAFLMIAHLTASLNWNPDWCYCFVRERDLMRGAAVRYGFTQIVPRPFTWIDPPAPREASEWLVATPRSELPEVARRALLAIRGHA